MHFPHWIWIPRYGLKERFRYTTMVCIGKSAHLMPQAGLDEVKVGRARVLVLLLDHLAGDPDEQDDGVGRLQGHLGELGEQLGDGQAVLLPDVIEQAKGVVLHHHVVRAVHQGGK